MNPDLLDLDALDALSSRACSPERGARRAGNTPPGNNDQQRPVCMLCVHCPKCADNRSGNITCELCRACHACSMSGKCGGGGACGGSGCRD